ncbi:alpha-2-macroglobulin, partial [Salmonella enterica subsp. enterica serovar Typhimurium]|nr:alpha-2-macroglobulin [Salmonella enterica subsp. enterica serovar Typhimurium]
MSGYTLEPVAAGSPLKTDEVYLDEIVLKRTSGPAMRFGIVEVPLPPGASADRTTWGIAVRYPGAQAAEALEQA